MPTKSKSKETGELSRAERERLRDTPFKSIEDLEIAEENITASVWKRIETARKTGLLLKKDKYKYVFERLSKGIVCNYGAHDNMVRVYADHDSGLIKVDIDEKISQTSMNAELLGGIVSGLSKNVQSGYYYATGVPLNSIEDPQLHEKEEQ